MGFSGGLLRWASQVALVVKKLPANTGNIRDLDSIHRSGRLPGRGHDNPPQYSCLQNPMDRGAWWATVHKVAKSWTRLKRLSTTVSVQFSCLVVSDSLRPHGLQHTRRPCPSPAPGVASIHVHRVSDAIQPSHPLSSPSLPDFNLSQHQELFQ